MMHEGDVLQIPHMESYGDGKIGSHSVLREWTVVQLCKYFVLCERNGERQCFTYGELIQLGYMKQDDVHEAMRKERCKYGFRDKDDYKRNYDAEVEE